MNIDTREITLEPADNARLLALCGPFDDNIKQLDHVIHYSDHKAVNALRYALSYLAKREQKECGIILKCSGLPEKSNRGRPRLGSTLPETYSLV